MPYQSTTEELLAEIVANTGGISAEISSDMYKSTTDELLAHIAANSGIGSTATVELPGSSIISLRNLRATSALTLTANTSFTALDSPSVASELSEHTCKIKTNGYVVSFPDFTFVETQYTSLHAINENVVVFFQVGGVNCYTIALQIVGEVSVIDVINASMTTLAPDYFGSSSATAFAAFGQCSTPFTGDVMIEVDAATPNTDAVIIGFNTSPTNSHYTTWQHYFLVNLNYTTFVVGQNGTYLAAPSPYISGTQKIRLARTGTTVKAQARVGGSWVDIFSFPLASSGAIYPQISIYDSARFAKSVLIS